MMTDSQAMEAIHALLDGVEWTQDTIENVAGFVQATGREIRPPQEVSR